MKKSGAKCTLHQTAPKLKAHKLN